MGGAAALIALTASAAVASKPGDVRPFGVSPPEVSGPIGSSASDVPLAADGVYPEFPVPEGYVEREFFISGRARIYEFTPTGVRVVAPCPPAVAGTELSSCSGLPYRTRMLVAMPKDKRRFSGTVWVNPLNPSAGYDYRVVWDRSKDYFVRKGDIVVMWTAKSVAVEALKGFNPQR